MNALRTPWHLVKRLVGSVTATALTQSERCEVESVLLAAEHALFQRLTMADQRHALHVLRRFDAFATDAPAFARRAALLHDIGKIESSLGTAGRVVATVLGPRTTTFRRYLEHESLGVQLLRAAGSDARTLDLLRVGADAPTAGSDVPTPDSITQWRDALRRADAV